MNSLSVDQRRVRREHHDMGPIVRTSRGRHVRRCSCGWNAGDFDRVVVMAAAKLHRLQVANYARLVRRGMAEFYVPPAPRVLSERERADLAAFSADLRRAFR